MDIVALMIGRGGSSLLDKNILPVMGVPLLLWSAAAARRSRHIGRCYVSSDDDKILATAGIAGYRPIRRPAELSTATAQSCDAVRHAVGIIAQDGDPDIVVVQHANVGTITEQMIDACIDLLIEHTDASSVVPAHDKAEYHPMRAMFLARDGFLKQAIPGSASANRQELPKCLFFDHSFWVLRRSAIFDPNGQPPWNCMGARILPYETHGCLDVHSLEDVELTAKWLVERNIPTPQF